MLSLEVGVSTHPLDSFHSDVAATVEFHVVGHVLGQLLANSTANASVTRFTARPQSTRKRHDTPLSPAHHSEEPR